MKMNYKVCGINPILNKNSDLRQWADYILTVTDDYVPHTNFQIHCMDTTNDDGPTIAHLDDAVNFIKTLPEGSNILIHCHAGISRSPGFLLYILIEYEGLDYITACRELYNIRPMCHPNKKILDIIYKKYNI